MTADQIGIIRETMDYIEELKEVVKGKLAKYKCHAIALEDLQELAGIAKSIYDIFEKLGVMNTYFEDLTSNLADLERNFDMAKVSAYFEEEMLTLLEQSQEVLRNYVGEDTQKRIIKVKYVDFYPEFQPEEHWLYQLLIKRYQVVFSEQPDYLFFSCFGSRYLQYDCIRIFISNEAVYPNFNLYDYAVTYADFTVTDRLLQNRDAFIDLKCRRIADSREEAEQLYNQKGQFCNFVFSNGERDPFSKELFDAISKYQQVTSGGRYLNNIGHLVDNLEEFQRDFRFSISCENSYYKGYITEKIVNALNAKTIPIYWGDPDVSDIINTKAIINCHDYPDIDSVVREIIRLNEDREAYIEKVMQPILVNEQMPQEYEAQRAEFIYSIIDQPYAQAFRRNRGLRGQWYNDWFCHMLGYPNEWFSEEKGYFIKRREVLTHGPLVSILIPVYNRKEIVKEAIQSALEQSYQDIEIIIVDNCSTDGTYEELLSCYGEQDNIQIYQNSENIGPVNNWRECLKHANGKYVKILWSDDLLGRDFVAKCVEVMEKDPTIGMAYCSCFIFMNDDRNSGFTLYQLNQNSGTYNKQNFYQGMFQEESDLPVSPGCAMFRREDVEILQEIPNDLGVECNKNGAGIDLMIYLHALSKHSNYYYFREVMSYFRYHEGSITASNNLLREYNLAKLYFCMHSEDAVTYQDYMKMRVLRDEGVKDAQEGVEILQRYGCMMEV